MEYGVFQQLYFKKYFMFIKFKLLMYFFIPEKERQIYE
ncbi:hypothetical protein LEP1GSC072_3561 [Leptospira noguchii str. Bonito]|nr:hypothetical protein LEP1GSC072_3561 [Leptospira noguchii str. Bonito]